MHMHATSHNRRSVLRSTCVYRFQASTQNGLGQRTHLRKMVPNPQVYHKPTEKSLITHPHRFQPANRTSHLRASAASHVTLAARASRTPTSRAPARPRQSFESNVSPIYIYAARHHATTVSYALAANTARRATQYSATFYETRGARGTYCTREDIVDRLLSIAK